jgi:hypothetical protein
VPSSPATRASAKAWCSPGTPANCHRPASARSSRP